MKNSIYILIVGIVVAIVGIVVVRKVLLQSTPVVVYPTPTLWPTKFSTPVLPQNTTALKEVEYLRKIYVYEQYAMKKKPTAVQNIQYLVNAYTDWLLKYEKLPSGYPKKGTVTPDIDEAGHYICRAMTNNVTGISDEEDGDNCILLDHENHIRFEYWQLDSEDFQSETQRRKPGLVVYLTDDPSRATYEDVVGRERIEILGHVKEHATISFDSNDLEKVVISG